MCGDLGLDEDRASIRIETEGDELRHRCERSLRQDLRIYINSDCMEIDDAVEGIMGILKGDPLPDRAKIIA